MPSITLTFTAPLNVSCQVGDTAYYVQTADISNTQFTINSNNVIEIGQIRQIDNPTSNAPTMICDTTLSFASTDNDNRFILFSKDNKANLSSILGYYADVKMVNNSKKHAEMHAITSDSFESSK
tara:strand:+ start:1431 stop:1802 length:372 start_codon:yes stop_codon:yes gene_type:complete